MRSSLGSVRTSSTPWALLITSNASMDRWLPDQGHTNQSTITRKHHFVTQWDRSQSTKTRSQTRAGSCQGLGITSPVTLIIPCKSIMATRSSALLTEKAFTTRNSLSLFQAHSLTSRRLQRFRGLHRNFHSGHRSRDQTHRKCLHRFPVQEIIKFRK